MAFQYHFFWQSRNPLSQWHPSPFTDGEHTYANAEQYMMAEKARLMGDQATRAEIMQATTPREIKALGRMISPFDPELWDREKMDVVYRGNLLKFEQNPKALKHLLRTRGEICEASPYDAIWGIGLDEATAECTPRDKWPGQNLLGKVLSLLRAELKK